MDKRRIQALAYTYIAPAFELNPKVLEFGEKVVQETRQDEYFKIIELLDADIKLLKDYGSDKAHTLEVFKDLTLKRYFEEQHKNITNKTGD